MKKSPKQTILLVEDDQSISSVIKYNLSKEGYTVIVANDGEEGLKIAKSSSPDLVILDWMLPRKSGLDVCLLLREDPDTSNMPIIMISARDDDLDKVAGLERGADDYITKPFSPIELIARMRAVLRRMRPAFSDKKLNFLDIEMDLSSHTVSRCEQEVKLAPIEFQILHSMMEQPEKVLSRQDLIRKIWGVNVEVDSRTVDVHMTRLRKALITASKDNKDLIKTVRLAGYKISAK